MGADGSETSLDRRPRVVVDDAETDWGWTKGVAGDTAASGLWTRGAPIGTSSGSQPCSPSADNTPAPGVQCYLTGNAGGSLFAGDLLQSTTARVTAANAAAVKSLFTMVRTVRL